MAELIDRDLPPPSDRVRVRRKPERGHYDRATVDAIIDRAIVGHVGYVEDGQPYVIPTAIWRQGDRLYWHGSVASRMLRATAGARVCITVSRIDALVLARSGFDHSVDYHSAVILGTANLVVDEAEKLAALEAFVERLYPGRWATLRPPRPKELKATTVLWTDLSEASAKIRDIGAHDEPGDETWPTWAGTIPLTTVLGEPIPDGFVPDGMTAPPVTLEAGA
jgi:nitroimidazol reductase NimA-like FMN-containing flavoprotein (pyridoxamine 5'-phosphate oxidase superfamily)